jgi:hypothetical protein
MIKIEGVLQERIRASFAPLNDESAVNSFPPPASLSTALGRLIPPGTRLVGPRNISRDVAKMFTTASVNMWLRAVHSFLISTSLTDVSPIWASVSGYYSSHYSVRALAHLLGYFQLFGRKQIVRLELENGRYICTFDAKKASDREHRVYWRIVKRDRHFASDPYFTENCPTPSSSDGCDVDHRDRASYADHLPQLPVFRPLDGIAIRERVGTIAQMEVSAPPIPSASRFPEVKSVQIVAYHRLIRFRSLVDTVIGDANRFWKVYREPAWARTYMNFELTQEARPGAMPVVSGFTL